MINLQIQQITSTALSHSTIFNAARVKHELFHGNSSYNLHAKSQILSSANSPYRTLFECAKNPNFVCSQPEYAIQLVVNLHDSEREFCSFVRFGSINSREICSTAPKRDEKQTLEIIGLFFSNIFRQKCQITRSNKQGVLSFYILNISRFASTNARNEN